MHFNNNNNPLGRVYNPSKPSSSHLGSAIIIADKENALLNNSGIYEPAGQGFSNMPKDPSALKGDISAKKKKTSPFGDGNTSMSSPKIIGKRGPPPEDITTRANPQKKRRVDVARGPPAADYVSKDPLPRKQGLDTPDLLPIQYDSWLDLPERWEYYGPDGRRIKQRRWSPKQDGDKTTTYKSDRLNQSSDRNNATAATVAAWVHVNRLRSRYQQLVAEFHSGPLVMHHLADKESEQQWANITQASIDFEKSMAGVGRALPPHPRFSRVTAAQITRLSGEMEAQIIGPVGLSPPGTISSVTQAKDAGSDQAPMPTDLLVLSTLAGSTESLGDAMGAVVALPVAPGPTQVLAPAASPIQPALPPAPSTLQPPTQGTAAPELNPSGNTEQEELFAGPSNLASSTEETNPTPCVTHTTQSSTTPPPVPSAPSTSFSFVSSTGQFRFTAAGETRFKLLCEQERYDEMYEMLPTEQNFDHLTKPDAISAFRSIHPRPNKGGQKPETELWVCNAKVKMVIEELPRVNEGDALRYSYNIAYLDEPCGGVTATRCNTRRHKQRTHLGRPY